MGFHHSVTLYLLLSSYMLNVWEAGAVISIIHDITDMFGHTIKVCTQLRYDKVSVVSFAFVLASWGYLRNIILPICIYQMWNTHEFDDHYIIRPIWCTLLSCLVLLHYYWYFLFIKALKRYIKEGNTEDV